MTWGLRQQVSDMEKALEWVRNTLTTIVELDREPTKAELMRIIRIMDLDAKRRGYGIGWDQQGVGREV